MYRIVIANFEALFYWGPYCPEGRKKNWRLRVSLFFQVRDLVIQALVFRICGIEA